MPFNTTEEAVRAWVEGWAVSRGAARPTSRPWGFTVDVGLPGEVARHVVTAADEATVRELAENTTACGTPLKVFVPARTLKAWLPPGWALLDGHAAFMAARLSAVEAPPRLPDGYRLHCWDRAGVTRAVVCAADGSFAARGQIAVTGPTAVVDQVETDPAHRRRGLGRVVMGTLAETAARQGARAAVLGATGKGRTLYEAVGWQVVAPLSAAVREAGTSGIRSSVS
ncbi:GNAT family N-acetyltransferase [Streptomyces sp. WELS2]|uniref:GNAT family N-acetyltransferase n=1 Tax=Streptomyces sp. WELS2 TaxID=2749435 RepID=UPI002867E931|nr:GNAT family N-acetyltransferase [Streptomyces sp. WELS2]